MLSNNGTNFELRSLELELLDDDICINNTKIFKNAIDHKTIKRLFMIALITNITFDDK